MSRRQRSPGYSLRKARRAMQRLQPKPRKRKRLRPRRPKRLPKLRRRRLPQPKRQRPKPLPQQNQPQEKHRLARQPANKNFATPQLAERATNKQRPVRRLSGLNLRELPKA